MNLAQVLDPACTGLISWERAIAPQPLIAAGFCAMPTVREHRAPETVAGSGSYRGRRRPNDRIGPGSVLVLRMIARLAPASLEGVVRAVSSREPKATRRVVTVRLTNLHIRGYLARSGERARFRYALSAKGREALNR